MPLPIPELSQTASAVDDTVPPSTETMLVSRLCRPMCGQFVKRELPTRAPPDGSPVPFLERPTSCCEWQHLLSNCGLQCLQPFLSRGFWSRFISSLNGDTAMGVWTIRRHRKKALSVLSYYKFSNTINHFLTFSTAITSSSSSSVSCRRSSSTGNVMRNL